MKKIIILSALFLLLGAGCNEVKQTEKLQTKDANKTTKTLQINNPTKEQKTSMTSIEDQKNLVAEYSKAVIKTNKGDITVEFYGDESPITVNNFLNLAQEGFYDGTKFHRVIKDFMIQGGDPNTKTANVASYGTGGPNYRFNDEFNSEKLVRGSLAMANSGPNTNGSQFFIVTAPSTPWLDGHHTNFGHVVDGMDVVDAIENSQTDQRDNPVDPIIVESIELLK